MDDAVSGLDVGGHDLCIVHVNLAFLTRILASDPWAVLAFDNFTTSAAMTRLVYGDRDCRYAMAHLPTNPLREFQ